MLRDDDETRAVLLELSALHGARQIIRLGYDGHARQPPPAGAFATVDETHAMTLRSWATFHAGEILTPIATDPPTDDRCVTHFLGLFEREMRSTKSGQEMPCRHGLETDR